MSALRTAIAAHPLGWRLLQLTAAAALGEALPDLLHLAHRVLG